MKSNGAIICGLLAAAVGLSGQSVSGAARHQAVTRRHRAAYHHRVYRQRYSNAVSLVVERAPIRPVLQVLFRRGGHNFVLGQGVSGTVTASLHDVPFATALQQVLSVNSVPLTETVQGKIYVITVRPLAPRRAAARPASPLPARPLYRRPMRRYRVPAYVLPGTGTVRVVP